MNRVVILFGMTLHFVLPSLGGSAQAVENKIATPAGVTLVEDMPYREGNEAWKLDLAMPKSSEGVPRPGLVFVHGGGWRAGDKRQGYFLRGALDYARKGYVAITVNYRLTGEAPFPACVEDVQCAVRWFRAHAEKYNVDPDGIGGYGNSAGAHLVLMLGLAKPTAGLEGDGPYQEYSSTLNAVCASAPPCDFLSWSKRPRGMQFLTRKNLGLLAGPVESFPDRAKQASPLTYVDANAPPLLLFQGGRDSLVFADDTDRFVDALRDAGAKDVTYKKYADEPHSVFVARKNESFPLMEAFFERTLRRNERQIENK